MIFANYGNNTMRIYLSGPMRGLPDYNFPAFDAAAQAILGEHDFSAFRAVSCQARHARRNVHAIEVRREDEHVLIDVEANAFLHHMVRNIVGSLLPIGRGERPAEWLAELLTGRNREVAGPTAPASGLDFVGPRYPESCGLPATLAQCIS
jgi:tRNA pseudouridine38-40 synthase